MTDTARDTLDQLAAAELYLSSWELADLYRLEAEWADFLRSLPTDDCRAWKESK